MSTVVGLPSALEAGRWGDVFYRPAGWLLLPDLQQVRDLVDTKDVPAVCLSHLSLDAALYNPLEGDCVVAASNPDLRCIDEGVLLQNQPDGIHHLVIIVLLGRSDLDPVDHIPAPRNPPGKDPG